MTTQIDYEAIARENGYCALKSEFSGYWYSDADPWNRCYSTPEEVYKALCVENNLVEGE